jgi:hypothetical protein
MAAFFDPNSGHADLGLHGQEAVEAWWRQHLQPEQVSQVVAWLADENCPVSGETLFTGGGQVSLQFTALTEGLTDLHLTPEAVHAHHQAIVDTNNSVPVNHAHGLSWLFSRLVAGGAPPVPERK